MQGNVDIPSLLDGWARNMHARNMRAATIKANVRMVGSVSAMLGWACAAEYTGASVLGWLEQRRLTIGPGTYNKELMTFRAFGKYLVCHGHAAENPLQNAQPAHAVPVGARALECDEVTAIVRAGCDENAARGRRRNARGLFWLVMATTALRHKECAALKWSAFHLTAPVPFFVTDPDWDKTRKQVEIAVHPALVPLLKAHSASDCTTGERIWKSVPLHGEWTRDRMKAGVRQKDHRGRHASPHSLRKSFATWLACADVNTSIVNYLMRHAQHEVTARYIDPPLSVQSAALQHLPDVFKGMEP